MVDDYSYRQYIAKKVNWYRENDYYDYLIQTWGGGDRDLKGQVLAELYKLRKPKPRKSRYKPVLDSQVDQQNIRRKESSLGGWGWVIFFIGFLTLSLAVAFFGSLQTPNPVTRSEAPTAVLQKPELEKELQTVKRPDSIIQEIKTMEPIIEKKEEKEIFYMGIKISR